MANIDIRNKNKNRNNHKTSVKNGTDKNNNNNNNDEDDENNANDDGNEDGASAGNRLHFTSLSFLFSFSVSLFEQRNPNVPAAALAVVPFSGGRS